MNLTTIESGRRNTGEFLPYHFRGSCLRNQAGDGGTHAYWGMYEYLVNSNLRDKDVLVVGCGFGGDALRIAKLGARVSAFDLSPDSLQIARALAKREGLEIALDEMPAEQMRYMDDSFDYIIARDILHHVDIPLTMKEIVRVARPGAVFVVNEIYSHSITDKIKHSSLVEKVIYPRMCRLIHGPGKPYITEHERKLSEHDLRVITNHLQPRQFIKYFNFLVTRLVPDRYDLLCKFDRMLLRIMKPIAPLLAGRVLFSAQIEKWVAIRHVTNA